jgi:hypothetical protein
MENKRIVGWFRKFTNQHYYTRKTPDRAGGVMEGIGVKYSFKRFNIKNYQTRMHRV